MGKALETDRLEKVYQAYAEREATRSVWTTENCGNRQIVYERNHALEAILYESGLLPLTTMQILEIGCGMGNVLAQFQDWGAMAQNLYGVDLLADRVEQARNTHPKLTFIHSNAESLQLATASFDMVVFYTVFSSILDQAMAHNVATEAMRVLKPGGSIIWYDFRYNNPHNPHVRGMERTQIQYLFPDFELQLRTITLLPPLARRLGPLTSIFYPLLACIPFLRTHYLGLLVKPC